MKSSSTLAAAFAGLLFASGSALAQTTAVPAAPDPAVGGQGSTMSPSGVANPTQRPDGNGPASRAAVRSDARANNHSSGNTATPAGQPSTMTNNQPNATPPTGAVSRADAKPTRGDLKPQLGQTGERPDVPTNPKSRTGTPQ